MDNISIRAYTEADAAQWDAFCATCVNATFLHTRKFLSYHGDRFQDVSCLIEKGDGNGNGRDKKIVGVFPAAEHPVARGCVVSHPGITYGGVLHAGRLVGSDMIDALTKISSHYQRLGYEVLRYKPVPNIYHQSPAQDDLYALFRLEARRYRCDVSSTIDLAVRREQSDRRKRGLKKAQKMGLEISGESAHLGAFWTVLAENLAREHGSKPAHSLAELQQIWTLFPKQLRLVCALHDGQVIAGTLLFITERVHHAQYIASNEIGYATSALDLVFDHCIAVAAGEVRYFDFGISNESEGKKLNDGLYQYKTEFGGGGVAYEFYELALTELAHE